MAGENNLFGNEQNNLDSMTGEDALASLVGEGKKYATAEEMAKGMFHSQQHIGTLEQENAGMRDTANKAKGVDDILAALKGQQQQPAGDNQPPADQQEQGPASASVEDLIAQAFDARDAKSRISQEETNKQSVIDSLAKTYGHQASQVYAAVASDLGLDLDQLAAKSPAAVLKLVAQARPAQATNGLPASTHQTQMGQHTSGVLNQRAINQMYADGKIKNLSEKHRIENEQLTSLGSAKFYE